MIVGLALIYAAATLCWLFARAASRPITCPKGHTDHYHILGQWYCRTCSIAAERRAITKSARERTHEARPDHDHD